MTPPLPAAAATTTAMPSSSLSLSKQQHQWWEGVPTKLIAKKTLVRSEPPGCDHLPVHTLTFEIPPYNHENFNGKAIHHSQLRLDHGDVVKMVIPNYKPKSYSVSRLDKETFDVTFKVYPNGRASGYLDKLLIGDTINSFGMSKQKQRNMYNSGNHDEGSIITHNNINLIAYGVGITEALPIAKAELEDHDEDATIVTLLWASRTSKDTFWHEDMKQLEQKFGNQRRFRLIQIFSREVVKGSLHGRITTDVLKEVFGDPKDQHNSQLFLSVGTKEMMRHTDSMLEQIGYPQPTYSLLIPKSGKT